MASIILKSNRTFLFPKISDDGFIIKCYFHNSEFQLDSIVVQNLNEHQRSSRI